PAIALWAGHDGHPRDIAARTREALDESHAHRILGNRHHDGGLRSSLLHGHGCSVDVHHEHIYVEVREFGSESGNPLPAALSESAFNRNILSLDVALVPQALLECFQNPMLSSSGTRVQVPDPGYLPRSLCFGAAQRQSKAKGENDREPDQPHGHLGEDGWQGV